MESDRGGCIKRPVVRYFQHWTWARCGDARFFEARRGNKKWIVILNRGLFDYVFEIERRNVRFSICVRNGSLNDRG